MRSSLFLTIGAALCMAAAEGAELAGEQLEEKGAEPFPRDPAAPSVEQEIQSKGLTAARVTPGAVDAVIEGEQFHVFPGTTTTVCCLNLRNGFTVIGESACASPENFNAELGRRIAREDAKRKIWALEGYLLKELLCSERMPRSVA